VTHQLVQVEPHGVLAQSGFAVDAAKHIGQDGEQGIVDRLHRTVDGDTRYVAQKVFPGPGQVPTWAFRRQGNLLGFDVAPSVNGRERLRGSAD
jgi:hypothetical protein